MIDIRSAGKTYQSGSVGTVALRGVNLEIDQGAYVAVRGPSGSGKTTLLNLIGLLDTPTAGEVILNGRATASLPERERARVRNRTLGFVFQSYNLIPELRAWENVALPGRYAGMPRRKRRDLAFEMLERVQLPHRAQSYPAQLSGGEK